MDMDKSLFLHELQCLVAALEEGNRINREALELNKALAQQNKEQIELNKKMMEEYDE